MKKKLFKAIVLMIIAIFAFTSVANGNYEDQSQPRHVHSHYVFMLSRSIHSGYTPVVSKYPEAKPDCDPVTGCRMTGTDGEPHQLYGGK